MSLQQIREIHKKRSEELEKAKANEQADRITGNVLDALKAKLDEISNEDWSKQLLKNLHDEYKINDLFGETPPEHAD